MPELDELSDKMKLSMEKELLGMYVSGHPLDEFRNVINENSTNTCAELNQTNDQGEFIMDDNKNVQVCGIVQRVNVKVTKKNTTMAFCVLEDMTGEVELIVFPATFDRYRNILEEDQIIMCSGRTNIKEDEGCKIIVSEVVPIADLKSEIMMSLYIDTIKDKNLLDNIEKTLRRFEGDEIIEIVSRDDNKSRKPKMYLFFSYDIPPIECGGYRVIRERYRPPIKAGRISGPYCRKCRDSGSARPDTPG